MTTPQEYFEQLEKDVKSQGIILNPDTEFTMDLIEGILTNRERFGKDYCPCRLPTGNKDIDRDIICPCVFRDEDIDDYGSCFCALFVSKDWGLQDEKVQIPERWDRTGKKSSEYDHKHDMVEFEIAGRKVWYCKVCGYVTFKEKPPMICPICKAKKEQFEMVEIIVKKS